MEVALEWSLLTLNHPIIEAFRKSLLILDYPNLKQNKA